MMETMLCQLSVQTDTVITKKASKFSRSSNGYLWIQVDRSSRSFLASIKKKVVKINDEAARRVEGYHEAVPRALRDPIIN